MKNPIAFLCLLYMISGSPLWSQHYSTGYDAKGYENSPYQKVRNYPLAAYHLAEEPDCLTCNDCQVVNQSVVLPTSTIVLLDANRQIADVRLTWEILSTRNIDHFAVRWRTEYDSTFQELIRFENESGMTFWHRNSPPSRLLYQVIATDKDGNQFLSNISEIPALEGLEDLQIYPNPGQHEVHLTVNGMEGTCFVLLRDVHGRVASQWQMKAQLGHSLTLAIPPKLPAGTYLFDVWQGGRHWRARWILLQL